MKISHLAATALVGFLSACDPATTPVTKKGYDGKPPIGTPIVFEAADELDVDGDGTGDGWWWVPFDGSTAAEETAVCANGSTTGLAINPGTTDDLLVFFDGGGACWSYATCKAGTAVDELFGEPEFIKEARDFIPCSITNRALLPAALTGATIVFVPYCTGDVHAGDNVATYEFLGDSVTWRHKGHANMRAFMRRLGATYDPPKLVVAGSSAGGFGSVVNYELFRWYWPDAQSFLLDDSGPALIGDELPATLRDTWYASWRVGIALDPWCLECRSDMSAAFGAVAELHPEDRVALVSHYHDTVMSSFTGHPIASDFADALDDVEEWVLRPTATARAFFDGGTDHMLLTPLSACGANASYVDDHEADGVSVSAWTLPAWIEAMLSGDPAWETAKDAR